MTDRDYQKEYWDRIHSWTAQKRAEWRANENHSCFTCASLVGFVIGVGLFYQTPYVAVGTIALTTVGALLGAGIDYVQTRGGKRKK